MVEMSAVGNGIQDYVLGNPLQEQERLKMQAKFLEKWSEQFFISAGLEPGMRVLDLGCGMGDVSLLAARLVGPSGHGTGIDRDGDIVEKARQRVRDEGRDAQIELIHADLLAFEHTGVLTLLLGVTCCFLSPIQSLQLHTQLDKFAQKESSSSTKWMQAIAFDATRTGQSLKRCTH
jgi:SAM-dependent methyltransferase